MRPPMEGSYWIVPGRLAAGMHPALPRLGQAKSGVEILLAAGVNCFVNLTESGEYGLEAYQPDPVETGSKGQPAVIVHHPIPDMGLASPQAMAMTLEAIDDALEQDHVVYVHCHAGLGRTGTVVGCWLARRLGSGQAALDELARLRRSAGLLGDRSPETDAQRRFVLDWLELDPRNQTD
ncbi:MAG TPA: hypothetical protein VGA52_01145 [Anaerolineales bacterium]